ncbi:MAG TPA: cellulose binding domain-containing protein, partial [Polyangiaceae bacterium]
TYLVVGAPYDNSVNPGEGSAFVYRRSDWGLDQKLTSGSIGPGVQRYGYSVAVDGTTVLVGAPDGGATNGGYVDVRERTGSGATPWEYATRLALDERGFDYRVGTSVSLAGNLALVGAVGDPLTGGGSGAAYLFARVGGTWNPINGHHLLPSDYGQFQAAFGWGVQLSGATALVTAPQTKGAVGAAYFYDGLADADSDGLLAADDCNDTDGIAVSCVLGAANLSFEPAPRPQWSADSGSFTLSTTHTDGTTAAKLGNGVAKLSSPLFSTTLLREIGSALAIDIQRPSTGSNAVTLFYSVPALNISQQVIGTVDLSSFPTGTWKTAALPLPTALRNVLAGQSTNVRFHLQFNAGAPNLLLDNLRFTGTFIPRAPAPPPGTVSATLTTTSSASNNYCMALKLGNSGSSPTSSWSVVINTQGTTITSNWNAAFSGTTGTVTLTSNQPFNSSIPAGATAHDPSVGFCANRAAGSGAVASVVSASGQ